MHRSRRIIFFAIIAFIIPATSLADLLEPGLSFSQGCYKIVSGQADPCIGVTPNFFSLKSSANTPGNPTVLKFSGSQLTRNKRAVASLTIPVQPNSVYSISAKIKLENRNCYNYLGENYQTTTAKEINRGFWCGEYSIDVTDPGFTNATQKTVFLSQPWAHDSYYIRNQNLDWHPANNTIRTSPNTTSIIVRFNATGLEGVLEFDELEVKRIADEPLIDDPIMKTPIIGNPFGFKIVSIKTSPEIRIETNEAILIFDGAAGDKNIIQLLKKTLSGNVQVGLITLPPQSLNGATVGEDSSLPGLVKVESQKIRFSVGADSSIIGRALEEMSFDVRGMDQSNFNRYGRFEAGVIFDANLDSQHGLFFSPVHGLNADRLRYSPHPINDVHFNDAEAEKVGVKNYITENISPDGTFDQSSKVTYKLLKGEYFVGAVFPPRARISKEICNNSLYTSSAFPTLHTKSQTEVAIKDLAQNHKIAFLYMGQYDTSENSIIPNPFYYYIHRVIDENGRAIDTYLPPIEDAPICPVASQIPSEGIDCKIKLTVMRDVAGPNQVSSNNAGKIQDFIKYAHSQGLKVVAYVSPQFRFSKEPEILMQNIAHIVHEHGMDGIYYDGRIQGDPLAAFRMARLTRNILGPDKIYIQHNSYEEGFLYRANRYRVPTLDAYANILFLGEHVLNGFDYKPGSSSCPPLWGMMYAGRGLSNAPAILTRELRFIPNPNNPKGFDTINPEEVARTQISCEGGMYMPPSTLQEVSFDGAPRLNIPSQNYLVSDYHKKFNALCKEEIQTPSLTATPTPSVNYEDSSPICLKVPLIKKSIQTTRKRISQLKSVPRRKQEISLISSLKKLEQNMKRISDCEKLRIKAFGNSRRTFKSLSSRSNPSKTLKKAKKLIATVLRG